MLQVLARPEMSELAPGMPQPKRRLARVHADAEQLELEDGLQFPILGRRIRLDTESALPDAFEPAMVLAELVFEGG